MNRERRSPALIVARILVGLGLMLATLWILRPFLVPMVWAAIAAYVSWPLFAQLRAWTRRPKLTAGLLTFAIAGIITVPVGWLLFVFTSEATVVATRLQEWAAQGAPLPEWISARPWMADRINELRASPLFGHSAVGEWVGRYGSEISTRVVSLTGGIARNVFEFVIMLVVLFVFYVDGERIGAQARRLARILVPSEDPRLVDTVGAIVRAVVFGLLGTAIIQGFLAGVGFAIFSVPSAVFFGFVTALASLIPAGPALIWIGACIWLYMQGELWRAAGLAVWGAVMVSSIDNVIRPLLISGPTRIPFVLVFFGVLGGLASFGLLGMFVGPVLLAVAFGLLAEFPARHPLVPGSPAPKV
jgi:predicted PurR-regulated permease PerM